MNYDTFLIGFFIALIIVVIFVLIIINFVDNLNSKVFKYIVRYRDNNGKEHYGEYVHKRLVNTYDYLDFINFVINENSDMLNNYYVIYIIDITEV